MSKHGTKAKMTRKNGEATFPPGSSTTGWLGRFAEVKAVTTDPEAEVRKIIQGTLPAGETLPSTKRMGLFHIRGVGNDTYNGGEDKDVVIYGPEFLWVLDVGYPALAAVGLTPSVSGRGYPDLPNFTTHFVRSVASWNPQDALYPCMVGELLVAVKEGTTPTEAKAALKSYVDSVSRVSDYVYLAKVKPYHELEIAGKIEAKVKLVRYAEPNGIARLIDFKPGWFVDRLA